MSQQYTFVEKYRIPLTFWFSKIVILYAVPFSAFCIIDKCPLWFTASAVLWTTCFNRFALRDITRKPIFLTTVNVVRSNQERHRDMNYNDHQIKLVTFSLCSLLKNHFSTIASKNEESYMKLAMRWTFGQILLLRSFGDCFQTPLCTPFVLLHVL